MDSKFFLEDIFKCKVDLVVNHQATIESYILEEAEYVTRV